MEHIHITEYDELIPKDAKVIQKNIIDFIIYCKETRKLAPASIHTYLAAVKRFYDMNDIVLNWKKIKAYQGEFYRVVDDEAYTHEQIKLLVDNADMRDKAIILLLASTGIRGGALPRITLKDLTPIDSYDIYKIRVYRKTHEQYYTFCTPECRNAIDPYLDYRRRCGERFTSETPLFRRHFDSLAVAHPKPLTFAAVSMAIFYLLNKTGVRPLRPQTEGKSIERTSLPITHGFRKFCVTNMIRARVEFGARESLVGHKSSRGLDTSYDRRNEDEILQEYMKAVDFLTINEENRLRRKVETLTEKQDEIQKMKDKHQQEMASMREEMNKQFNQIMSIIQQNPELAKVKPEVLTKKIR
jgi:integrase